MAIKIQTKQDYIPIQLGDEEIRFYITDDAILRIRKGYEKVQKELEEIKKPDDEDVAVKKMKEVLKKGFDLLYGEGTFEKVYGVTPSVFVCLEYFQQMVDATFKELDKRGISASAQEKTKKYLQNKKK